MRSVIALPSFSVILGLAPSNAQAFGRSFGFGARIDFSDPLFYLVIFVGAAFWLAFTVVKFPSGENARNDRARSVLFWSFQTLVFCLVVFLFVVVGMQMAPNAGGGF